MKYKATHEDEQIHAQKHMRRGRTMTALGKRLFTDAEAMKLRNNSLTAFQNRMEKAKECINKNMHPYLNRFLSGSLILLRLCDTSMWRGQKRRNPWISGMWKAKQ